MSTLSRHIDSRYSFAQHSFPSQTNVEYLRPDPLASPILLTVRIFRTVETDSIIDVNHSLTKNAEIN